MGVRGELLAEVPEEVSGTVALKRRVPVWDEDDVTALRDAG